MTSKKWNASTRLELIKSYVMGQVSAKRYAGIQSVCVAENPVQRRENVWIAEPYYAPILPAMDHFKKPKRHLRGAMRDLADLRVDIARFCTQPPQNAGDSYQIQLSEDIADAIFRRTGNCINEVRSCLDTTAYICAKAVKHNAKATYFPHAALASEKNGARIRGQDIPEKIFDLFWSFNPFGPNSLIHDICSLGNAYKHKLVDEASCVIHAERHFVKEAHLGPGQSLTINGRPLITSRGGHGVFRNMSFGGDSQMQRGQFESEGLHFETQGAVTEDTPFDVATSTPNAKPSGYQPHIVMTPLFGPSTNLRGRPVIATLTELVETAEKILHATELKAAEIGLFP